MKALVLHGRRNYKIENNWSEPAVRPAWARVKVQYSGICGSDLPRFGKAGTYHYPIILGHEFTGIVDSPAPNSSKFKGGEQVAVLPIIPCGNCSACAEHEPFHCKDYQFIGSRNDGGFAEFCLVPEKNLFPLPDHIDPRIGAFVEPLMVTLHAVRTSGFSAGQTALVFGAGTIGILTALWLRSLGAGRIAVCDTRPESLEIARKAGIPEVINFKEINRCIKTFDLTFEAAGATPAFISSIRSTVTKGAITIVGRNTADTTIPLEDFELLIRNELTLKGSWGYTTDIECNILHTKLKEGLFPIFPLITHEISLDEAPEVIKAMLDKTIYYCKILIKM